MKVNILGKQRTGLKDWVLNGEKEESTFSVSVLLSNGQTKKFLDITHIEWTFRGANVELHTLDKIHTCDFSYNVDEVQIKYSK